MELRDRAVVLCSKNMKLHFISRQTNVAATRAVVKKSIRDPISIHAEKARDRSKNVWIDLFQVTKGTIFFDAQGAPIKSECRVNETET